MLNDFVWCSCYFVGGDGVVVGGGGGGDVLIFRNGVGGDIC